MAKRRLKGYVKRTLFILSVCTIAIGVMNITKNLKNTNEVEEPDYVMNAIMDSVTPVVETTKKMAGKPYNNPQVAINKTYYERTASEKEQENSLIYYENTYLQNSGIIYGSSEEFDVIPVLEGTIIDIKQDDILNTIVYISHNNNLTTIYYGLKDVNVKVNDIVTENDSIGKSNTNKFCTEKNSMLFEVNYNGEVMNPEKFFAMSLDELN